MKVAAALIAARADRVRASPLEVALGPEAKAEALAVWRKRVDFKADAKPNR